MAEWVQIVASALESLEREARRALPAECCGLLAGRGNRVENVVPVTNAAERGETRFEMAPTELWAARRRVEAFGLEVLGFYHSHPRTSPVPSSYDIERAYYPEALYVIVGLEPRVTTRAYRIAAGAVHEVMLDVAGGDAEPEHTTEERRSTL